MLSFFDTIAARPGRREFLKLGSLAMLPGARLWASERSDLQPGSPVTGKSVVFLFMQGGPTQFETFDPKMDVPVEIRSVGGEIPTAVPGMRFGCALPKLAKLADKLAVVRNFVTGTQHGGLKPIVSEATNGISVGAVYSRIAGTNHPR